MQYAVLLSEEIYNGLAETEQNEQNCALIAFYIQPYSLNKHNSRHEQKCNEKAVAQKHENMRRVECGARSNKAEAPENVADHSRKQNLCSEFFVHNKKWNSVDLTL